MSELHKPQLLVPIWASENAALVAGSAQWSFGNGATGFTNQGVPVYVPAGQTCDVVAMGLFVGGGSARVALVVNGTSLGTACDVSAEGEGAGSVQSDFPAYSLSNSDYLNFITIAVGGTPAAPNQVVAWLEYKKA